MTGRRFVLVALCAFGLSALGMHTAPAHAASLSVQPLLYNETLRGGEKKKGYIDVRNQTPQKQTFVTSVRAFRQIDDTGSLRFYDDPVVTAGLTPDLKEFELGPHEALRLYFGLNGEKLPQGDVFAALFVTTKEGTVKLPQQVVSVGTLFTLSNGTPARHTAALRRLSAAPFVYGDSVRGTYAVANTAPPGTTNGFYPKVTVALTPFGSSQTIISPLVFAGNTREVRFGFEGACLGIYKLSAQVGDSRMERWIVVVTGFWAWLLPLIVAAAITFVVVRRSRPGKITYRR